MDQAIMKKEREISMFQFLKPFTDSLWLTIFATFLIYNISLTIAEQISRVLKLGNFDNQHPTEKTFNWLDSFWFSCGSLMQQGCEENPRTLGGRIMTLGWWGFCLIMTSTYTANLAAFLTVQYSATKVESVDALLNQTEVQASPTVRQTMLRNNITN
jgi:ionotropic glutamate receptor